MVGFVEESLEQRKQAKEKEVRVTQLSQIREFNGSNLTSNLKFNGHLLNFARQYRSSRITNGVA